MSIAWLLTGYCILVVVASAGGGWLPAMMRMTHLRTQLLMSFVAGLMLGIATLHLLPHAVESLGSTSRVGATTLVGVLGMFLLLRAFHVHTHAHHEAPLAVDPEATLVETEPGTSPAAATVAGQPTEQGGDGDRQAATDDASLAAKTSGVQHRGAGVAGGECPTHSDSVAKGDPAAKGLGWVGMLFGLGLHTVMDGVALGASVAVDAAHGAWLGLAGLGTFLAVALHKPLDAFAISSVMATDGWSPRQRTLVNLAFSLCCPLGAGLFYFGATRLTFGSSVVGYGLALSAGFFICIALADLLPEVHFHDHDRGKLTAALLIGVALAIGIENLPGHSHDHHDVISVSPDSDASPGERFRARLRGELDAHGHGHDHHGHGHHGHSH